MGNESEADMQERKFTVRNKAGIHCRPSGVILNTIKKEFPNHYIEIASPNGLTLEANSILSLISLELSCGTEAILRAEGIDEEIAVKKLGDLLETEFDFPPLNK